MNILFLCKDNSIYSQIAEVLTNHFHKHNVMAYSAGFLKAMNANPYLQTVLAKYSPENNGYEVKSLEDVRTINFDYVITINAMDYFPDIPFLRKIEWRVSTTDDGSIEDIVHITQQLSTKVQSFILNIAA